MPRPFVLAQLSDVHLGPLPRLGLVHLNVKRGLGWLNWHLKRRFAHSPAVLHRILEDLLAQSTDHIALTGDLVNIGLPEEYVAAARWMETLGPPDQVTVIPGNHDIYTRLGREIGVGRWQPWMRADGNRASEAATFPFVRRRGPVALVALNSAVETRPFSAIGELGRAQLSALGPLLDGLRAEGLVRVVLIHHPPLPGMAKPAKALRNAAALAHVLATHGAELVIHGHNHGFALSFAEGLGGSIPVVGAGSASMALPHPTEDLASYNLYRIMPAGEGVTIELSVRGLERPDGPIVERRREIIRRVDGAASASC